MGKHRPPARKIFAISKCQTSNPLIVGWCGTIYTKHYLQKGMDEGKPRTWIVNVEISKELAEQLIQEHKMTIRVKSEDGTLWDTTPSLLDECRRLGLTYSHDLRRF